MSLNDGPSTTAKKVVDWLNTDEGQQALKEALQCAEETIARLRKSRQIDCLTLQVPFGPVDGSGIWPHQRS